MTQTQANTADRRHKDWLTINRCIIALYYGVDQRKMFQFLCAVVAFSISFNLLSSFAGSLGRYSSLLSFIVLPATYWAVGRYSKWPQTTYQKLVDAFHRYEPINESSYRELMVHVTSNRPVRMLYWMDWRNTEKEALARRDCSPKKPGQQDAEAN